MVRIKICGITRPQDGVAAAREGADAVGLVLADSPRRVDVVRAREIVQALPPYVSVVGVFVDAAPDAIRRAVGEIGLSEVQLHGDEPAAFVEALGLPRVVKALRVRDRTFVDDFAAYRDAGVAAILLDAFSTESRGGSGKRFDWDLVAGARDAGALDGAPPIVLAGGLTPDNVAAGIRRIRPWGVDVSGGVEMQPGVKSPELIARFIAAARRADQ